MLSGKKILVTAGPTLESLDLVRFLSNRSSGKMGYCIADNLADNGASVLLISGPVNQKIHNKTIDRIDVESADEMLNYCLEIFPGCDGAIMAAAVSDFTPLEFKPVKIKKTADTDIYTLTLKKTTDILKELGKIKTKKQVLAGFSLEAENEFENATRKMIDKNLDFIVLNSLNDDGAGFGYETNKITIINKNLEIIYYPLKHKAEVAKDIVDYFRKYL